MRGWGKSGKAMTDEESPYDGERHLLDGLIRLALTYGPEYVQFDVRVRPETPREEVDAALERIEGEIRGRVPQHDSGDAAGER
jgi:hypothetical protein